MPNDEFAPNLTKLDRNYQILTELHREGASRTYLARHLGLNRDVTITVVRAGDNNNDAALPHLASDARLLTAMRHPNIIPVIEGIWLDARTFAVVRARVRGSRVDQLIDKNGPVPIGQVATTIQTVHDAISWARSNGVVHRRVTPSSVMFQQGNQRVVLTLELAPFIRGAIPDECDDVRTIGVLASDMMLGRITRPGESALAVNIPPNILGAVSRSVVAVRRCHAGNAKQVVGSLLTALHAAAAAEPGAVDPVVGAVEPSATEAVGATVEPVAVEPPEVEPLSVEPVRAEPVAIAAMAAETQSAPDLERHYADAVAVVESPFGFNARLGTAVAAAAIIGVLAVLSFRHRSPATNVGASMTPTDTHAQAGGDVSSGATPTSTKSATPRPTAALPPAVNSAMGLNTRACRSPTAADQRTCLIAAIERNDVEMNAAYTKLIRALRRESTAAAGDPDPVTKLRRSQRKWSDDRDVVCRKNGTGALYAPVRASCFAQWSADRARELQTMLNALPPSH